jgi:KamA family protein
MAAVAAVFPFRVNSYVIDELIDWSNIPDDPIFQLTFPQPGMLEVHDLEQMERLLAQGAGPREIQSAAREIQARMNPHPAGQKSLNVPTLNGVPVDGLQHKYRETVLVFPRAGQTCHAYCTYCFRWPQFVGNADLKFAAKHMEEVVAYLRAHREVTDVLITGGDPLIMRTELLKRTIEPLLDPSLEHITNIRIGTKALSYWPQRLVSDADASDLLKLFGNVRKSGRQLALMAHYSHPRELETEIAQQAVRKALDAGAIIRSQAPLIRHVNDNANAWETMWKKQVHLGAVPYYMFVERDTGPKKYFELPLARGFEIFTSAYRKVSGLSRTVRGPSMSATPGKVVVDGISSIHGEKVFSLRFLQARDPEWVGQPFHATYDPKATWLDDLRPAFGQRYFFFEGSTKKKHGRYLPLLDSKAAAL